MSHCLLSDTSEGKVTGRQSEQWGGGCRFCKSKKAHRLKSTATVLLSSNLSPLDLVGSCTMNLIFETACSKEEMVKLEVNNECRRDSSGKEVRGEEEGASRNHDHLPGSIHAMEKVEKLPPIR